MKKNIPQKLLNRVNSLPDHPGVYFFLNEKSEILYIGKATSLQDRVSNYFKNRLTEQKEQMISEARDLKFELTDTVLEALILETNYIKKYKPKYNILQRDDRSMAYLVFTREKYPRLIILRARQLEKTFDPKNPNKPKFKIQKKFGPFFASSTIEKILKLLRPIIIFRTCSNKPEKVCFYARINQCPLHNKIPLTEQEYRKNLKKISDIFRGKTKQLINTLEKELKSLSSKQKYEDAIIVRDQIYSLKHINDISLIEEFSSSEKIPKRLEAYDISHFGGKNAVGAFVVFSHGKPEKTQYRRFIIRAKNTYDDPLMIQEVLNRRLKHSEWMIPDFILIDGGKIQLNQAILALKKFPEYSIDLVASAKGKDRKGSELFWANPDNEQKYDQKILQKLIKSAQAEAHHFAITFQKSKRKLV